MKSLETTLVGVSAAVMSPQAGSQAPAVAPAVAGGRMMAVSPEGVFINRITYGRK